MTLTLVGTFAGYALAEQEVLDEYLPLAAVPDHHRAIIDNDSARVLDAIDRRIATERSRRRPKIG